MRVSPGATSPRLAHSTMGGDGAPGLENLSARFCGCEKPAFVSNFHDGGSSRCSTEPATFGNLHERECRQPETVLKLHHGVLQSPRHSAICIEGVAESLRLSAQFIMGVHRA